MASKRWSLSRVWGNTRQNASTSGSTIAGPSNRSRVEQPSNGSQPNRSHSAPRAHATSSSHSRRPQRASREEEAQLSTPTVPDSLWFASDFMLGAGMVIIQPSSGKVVVLYEKHEAEDGEELHYWFLPKGRKDVGESLEQTALREAYEESGLRVSFLPIILPHNAPGAPGSLAGLDRTRMLPCTEAIYVSTQSYEKRGRSKAGEGEYLTFWYVGQIPENAVIESGTRMADEVNYETHFLSLEDALSVLGGVQIYIVNVAYRLWQDTAEMQSRSTYKEHVAQLRAMADASSAADLNASVGAGAGPSQERLVSTTQAAQDAESWQDSD
ncbi:hypothetical protein LXA43DRAFT_481875 [Ganoderma leucocontextum]|nr:hypothetical protein LXA43DRAFT_481875 [Ganoderma leucocontextum]